ncbi:2-C-methyl-D-erythritol 2,4-cyclodiphosphate synthase [Peptoanaerobacter stomatis]|uniref:2-C-methyl-D-erythritol 2,4-cyclodiphosphate synthase n=3 Tax=Peptoanaerobacter stomatis TaxID=796937 RepID=G9XAJ1_9FIRM|nr:2-C-methyl-D-erythritol 2,4-cyclodiphosphate synthase [Peptoanaerobacter stomatis]EHL16627.1 YgbB family protein [Peptoanaerobacter stomatis]EHL20011.1 YgbB family protein [Peptoanaerobacter stomatis]
MRVGIGYDVHKFEENRKLIIGGVNIPYEKGLEGHSDADVLIHSIIDALIGAVNKGDIGTLFPDTDDKYKDINSMLLLREVKKIVTENNFKISNIDSIIIAQSPKMLPYISKMKKNIAEVLDLNPEQVSVKATTTEKLGFEGRKEGISSQAVVLLEKIL